MAFAILFSIDFSEAGLEKILDMDGGLEKLNCLQNFILNTLPGYLTESQEEWIAPKKKTLIVFMEKVKSNL